MLTAIPEPLPAFAGKLVDEVPPSSDGEICKKENFGYDVLMIAFHT